VYINGFVYLQFWIHINWFGSIEFFKFKHDFGTCMCDFVQLRFHLLSLLFWFVGQSRKQYPERTWNTASSRCYSQDSIFKSYRSAHQVTFLHISWGMLLNLVYGQGAIRYKMYCMHSVAYLLYYGVISNCIIAYVSYLLY
jgi:hypothetical protein